MKKIVLSLGTISAIATPVITVIACGDNDSIADQELKVLDSSLNAEDFEKKFDEHETSEEYDSDGSKYFSYEQLKNDLGVSVEKIEEHKDLIFLVDLYHFHDGGDDEKYKDSKGKIFQVYAFKDEVVKDMKKIEEEMDKLRDEGKDTEEKRKLSMEKWASQIPFLLTTSDLGENAELLSHVKSKTVARYIQSQIEKELVKKDDLFKKDDSKGFYIPSTKDGSKFEKDKKYTFSDFGLDINDDLLKAYKGEIFFVMIEDESSYEKDKMITFNGKISFENKEKDLGGSKFRFKFA